MNDDNLRVLTNIIGAVESGGQVYEKRRYDAYEPPYANTPNEHTITLGWAQNYGSEAEKLIFRIYNADFARFSQIDTCKPSIWEMLKANWVAIKWNPFDDQKAVLIKMIDSEEGHRQQDILFEELMKEFISDCAKDYTYSVKAQMMYCEIRHLGGKSAADRIFKRCKGNYDISTIMAALVADQRDTSSSSQVGDRIFWNRHVCCSQWIEQYAVDEDDQTLTAERFVEAVRKVYEDAWSGDYTYGDSHGTPPTSDKVISCDRLVAKALWDLGYTDQPTSTTTTSGITIFNMDEYLTTHGWSRSDSLTDIHYGSIVLTKDVDGKPVHTFVSVADYAYGMIAKFDEGSQARIQSCQPFAETWSGMNVLHVYNIAMPEPERDIVKGGQKALAEYTGINLDIDGEYGPETALTYRKAIQQALNADFGSGLEVDGILGKKSTAAMQKHPIGKGYEGYYATALEIGLCLNGYDPSGVEFPGVFGEGLDKALRQYQKDKNLEVDGIAGVATFKSLAKG